MKVGELVINMKHPAKYTDKFIPIFYNYLKDKETVLDPMAGTGKLSKIREHGYTGKIYCNDILDWKSSKFEGVDEWTFCDAASLPYEDDQFDALCTSPTYGNRMADHFEAKDSSKRITYRHCYGEPLSKNNTGRMQWGKRYKEKHRKIYTECKRVLKDNGIFIVNISDHIRAGKIIPVVEWHKEVLLELGLKIVENHRIKTPRMGFGANRNARVQYEHVIVFHK